MQLDHESLSFFDAENGISSGTLSDKPSIRYTPRVVLLNGSQVVPEATRWLWPGWLAKGKLHLLAGNGGLGKTTIAQSFAASTTSGSGWPDGSTCEPGNVLIWTAEDGLADTLVPRLLAAGADLNRCYFIAGIETGGKVDYFDPSIHMPAINEVVAELGGVKLFIVDPVVAAIAGDSHKNTEVRRGLQPLVDLAERLDAAVVGISHFSKGKDSDEPASRVIGSVAFGAVPRLVMAVVNVKAEDGQFQRRLVRAKSNIGPDGNGFEYHIDETEVGSGVRATGVQWGAALKGTARELMKDHESAESGGLSAVERAKAFLTEALANGPTPTNTLEKECEGCGCSWASVRRASDELNVVKRRGYGGTYYWSLPHSPF